MTITSSDPVGDTAKPISKPTYEGELKTPLINTCCVDLLTACFIPGPTNNVSAPVLFQSNAEPCRESHNNHVACPSPRRTKSASPYASAYHERTSQHVCALDACRRNIFTIALKTLQPPRKPQKGCQRPLQQDVHSASSARYQ